MLTFRARLKPRSATRSPWQADTIFGHLCWLLRYELGEEALTEFLSLYKRGEPPLILSNGFPGDWLPRPLLPPPAVESGRPKQAQIATMHTAKAAKSIRWIGLDDFNALRRGEQRLPTARPDIKLERTILKNQINRLTFGTTSEDDSGGNLYNADELMFFDKENKTGLDICIYVRASETTWRGMPWTDRAKQLFEKLAQGGYGAKKSVGYGHFELGQWESFTGFDETLPNANGFISLSNWVPAQNDPKAGFYLRTVKYGKLGEEYATAENPFKFPLIMLAAGSSFYTDDVDRDWYGRLVDGVASTKSEVVQYGYAFAVPACLEETE